MPEQQDTLSRIGIAAAAVKRWSQQASALKEVGPAHGLRDLSQIPDELARVEPDGSVSLYVILPDGYEFSMRIEPGEWSWLGPRNQ